MLTANYERPMEATLIVRTVTGEEWEATSADLKKFRFLPQDAYVRARLDLFEKFLGIDLTSERERDAAENPKILEALNTALFLVEALAMYDHATLSHPEYREDAVRLGRLLGIEVPLEDEDDEDEDGGAGVGKS